jgi:hypothetical protein
MYLEPSPWIMTGVRHQQPDTKEGRCAVADADDDISPSDQHLMQALADAIGGTPPPVDLLARCEGLLAWIDVDSELAMLLEQPIAEVAGTRGGSSSATTLEFSVDDGSCVIELTPSDGHLRGQVLGAETDQVMVRSAAGVSVSLPVDESGSFSLDDPPSGAIRLELELNSQRRRIHTDWFVV